jgi:type IV pilus assembly protein PilA
MIVIVVVGLLSSVALPQFLGVRARAELGAEIAENIGLAKECSSAMILELPAAALTAPCEEDTGGEWISGAADDNSAGIQCGPNIELIPGDTCTITVNAEGVINYT